MIPLSLLWGFLSKEAVDATELRVLAAETGGADAVHVQCCRCLHNIPKEVFPLSM